MKYVEVGSDKRRKTKSGEYYASMESFHNAGLLLNDKVVLVDFDGDNVDEGKIISYLMEHYPTNKVITTRGTHLYYAKPKDLVIKNTADRITIGGFQVDYKTGEKNYAVVKLNGKVREGAEGVSFDALPELPIQCYPLDKAKNITGLEEGDARNNSLFYHLRCVREASRNPDIKAIANFINDTCFVDKLKPRELKGLVDSVTNLDISYETKNMIELADRIVEGLDICSYQGLLYFKDGKKYISDKFLLRRAINDFQDLKRVQCIEVEHQLSVKARIIDESNEMRIVLRNGTILGHRVLEEEPSFTPFYLDVKYSPNTYDEHVDTFLNEISCDRPEIRKTLEEILGHCLLLRGFPHKVFFLLGKGRNGKSTFLDMIIEFAGKLASQVSLANFNDETSLASMIGRIVNCSDDIDYQRIERTKNFKSISAGNMISIRPIYSSPISFRNTATLIVNANALPDFSDSSVGLRERMHIVPFDLDLRKSRMDPYLLEKLTTENAKSYILSLALKGLDSILKNGKLTENEYTKKAMARYSNQADNISAFLENNTIEDGDWLGLVYKKYVTYCAENITRKCEKSIFTKRLSSIGYDVRPVSRNKANAGTDNRDRQIFNFY